MNQFDEKRFELTKSSITDFRIYDNELEDAYFIDCKDEHTVEGLVDLLNNLQKENEQLKFQLDECSNNKLYSRRELEKENGQLKQTLKDSYINEICENCKYGHYYLSDNFDGGFEGDFECLKKHFDNEHWKCDGLKECDDFELDFKGDVE